MTSVTPAAVIVLAAGQGTRMKSDLPKVMHTIGGRTLVQHAIAAAQGAGARTVSVVVRHQRELVAEHIAKVAPDVVIADQDEVMGTGRACECGLDALPADLTGTVLVTMGDVPLLSAQTLSGLAAAHAESHAAVTVITADLDDATGYGRIVRDDAGDVVAIVEQKDAVKHREAGDELAHVLDITEINSGIYAFDAALLREALKEVGTENASGEKYLTDVLGIARGRGLHVRAFKIDDLWQTEGVNDQAQLARLGKELNRRIVDTHLRAGVTMKDPDTVWIDADVTIGRGTRIMPNVQLYGATTIGADCEIGPDCTIEDTEVGDGASVIRAVTKLAEIGKKATVGPFSYLRPGTRLGKKGKIGGFVETKNAVIENGAKVPHLTYCGDARVGEGANIGAGTIFANYDGQKKHHTNIGKHSFVGSNTVLVAPVHVCDGAYVAAGSALTDRVEPGQIAIARGRQVNKDGWVEKHKQGTDTLAAAEAAQREGDSSERLEERR